MKRIIVHWTAGGGRASDMDRKHYHRLVEYDGTVVAGTETIADNIVTSDGDYAAHTRNLNTGSIGVAVCAMRGATEHPFDAGPSPITEKQWRAMCILVADLAHQYSIPITRETVLTHAEVQPTLGVRQRGKWDITRLPFRADIVGALPVGDYMREMVRQIRGEPAQAARPALRTGAKGIFVRDLQESLQRLGHFNTRIDGDFGRRTRAAVVAFQADQGLIADGVVGPATWAALDAAKPAPLRDVTEDDLRKDGSDTMRGADTAQAGAVLGLGGLSIAEVVGKVEAASEALTRSEGIVAKAQALVMTYWPVMLAGVALFIVWRGAALVKDARLRDALTGRNSTR